MLGKPLLFLSAYAPLFALLAIRFKPLAIMLTCVGLAILGLLALLLLLRLDARATPGAHRLKQVKDADAEAGAYLGAYLLPFLTVSTPSVRDAAAYAGFIIISGAIYLHSSVVQINPLLYLLGYRVLQVVDTNDLQAYLVTRRPAQVDQYIVATRFRDDVLIDRTRRSEQLDSDGT
ncbi:hypothetical protein GCM10023191_053730 [Actinoallomurus oryzae]|uniref:Uncharacterized protein n=1 Tax=Actinoallomurus oryzae TaxID=502180 RepID=A0ABP8QHS2_9ACTN